MSLSNAMKKAAERHAKIAKSMIDGSDETLTINVRLSRATTSGSTMFSDLAGNPAASSSKGPFRCLWYDSNSIPSDQVKLLQLVGRFPQATAFAEVKLEDVLVDPSETHTETWLDQALDVVHRGQKFEVLATDRHGMANIAPYLMTIVLAGEIRRRA